MGRRVKIIWWLHGRPSGEAWRAIDELPQVIKDLWEIAISVKSTLHLQIVDMGR